MLDKFYFFNKINNILELNRFEWGPSFQIIGMSSAWHNAIEHTLSDIPLEVSTVRHIDISFRSKSFNATVYLVSELQRIFPKNVLIREN